MGVLVKYTLEVEAEDIKLLGEGMDLLPYGKVKKLVFQIQMQINQQETAEKKRIEDQEKWQQSPHQAQMPTRVLGPVFKNGSDQPVA